MAKALAPIGEGAASAAPARPAITLRDDELGRAVSVLLYATVLGREKPILVGAASFGTRELTEEVRGYGTSARAFSNACFNLAAYATGAAQMAGGLLPGAEARALVFSLHKTAAGGGAPTLEVRALTGLPEWRQEPKAQEIEPVLRDLLAPELAAAADLVRAQRLERQEGGRA